MQRMQKGLSALVLVVLAVLIMGCPNESSGSGSDNDNGSSSSAVTLISVTQTGGTDDTTTSTSIEIVFGEAITGLKAEHITLLGATKGELTGTGTTYAIAISEVTVANGASVSVVITGVPGYTITPVAMSAVVYLIPAPDVSNLIMSIADDKKTITIAGATAVGGIASYAATLTLGDTAVTGGSWASNVYTHTSVITSATSAALTYSVTVSNAGNKSVATGVVKGIGGGYAYYAVDNTGDGPDGGEDGGFLTGTNPTINGWYEISEELADTHLWAAAKTAASVYTGTVTSTGWKLPSIAELNAAYVSFYAENEPLNDSTLENFLWSSSEASWDNAADAWIQGFHNGNTNSNWKNDANSVRAVRAF